MRGLKNAGRGSMSELLGLEHAVAKQPRVNGARRKAVAIPVLEHALSPADRDISALAAEPAKWSKGYHAAVAPGETAMRRLDYWLYMPAHSRAMKVPLVVMLHGCEQTAEEFAQGTRMNVLAAEHGFAVLYPQQTPNAHPFRCWHWYDPAIDKGGGEADWIASLIERLIARRSIDRARIYAAGLSAGAAMAAMVALRFPNLVAAVGVHSGVVVGEARSAIGGAAAMQRGTSEAPASLLSGAVDDLASFPGMPAILLHGAGDDVVLPVNTDQLVEQFLRLNGLLTTDGALQTSPERPVMEKVTQHDVHQQHDYYRDQELKVRVCRIPALRHAWSGGDEALPFNSEDGPDASALMWEFFSQHQRQRPGSQPNPAN